jgi:uncharacterized protein YjbJ (UPF0337 family)
VGNKDTASNKAQDIKGKIKETVGKAVGNEKLEDKGKSDQAKAAVKDIGEKVKDAASKVKHVITDK